MIHSFSMRHLYSYCVSMCATHFDTYKCEVWSVDMSADVCVCVCVNDCYDTFLLMTTFIHLSIVQS